MSYVIAAAAIVILIIFLSGIRVVRPTTRGLVERLNVIGEMAGILPLAAGASHAKP